MVLPGKTSEALISFRMGQLGNTIVLFSFHLFPIPIKVLVKEHTRPLMSHLYRHLRGPENTLPSSLPPGNAAKTS